MRITLSIAIMMATGCAQNQYDGMPGDDSADTLIDVNVACPSEAKETIRYGSMCFGTSRNSTELTLGKHRFTPSVNATNGRVEIMVDHRILTVAANESIEIKIDRVPSGGNAGLALEYRPIGGDGYSWEPFFAPLPAFWDKVEIHSREAPEDTTITGDWTCPNDDDCIALMDNDEISVPMSDFELRVLVVPTYDFWDWNDGTWEIDVAISAL